MNLVLVQYKHMTQTIPKSVQKFFWGDSLSDLSWPKNKKYITQTLLEKGNSLAVKWLFTIVSRDEVRQMIPTLRLSKKSSNFWSMYLS